MAAYLAEAIEIQAPPSSEATRHRAYRYYEEALAAKNRGQCHEAVTVEPADA